MTLKLIALGLSCLMAVLAHQLSRRTESSKSIHTLRYSLLLVLVLYNAAYYVISYFTGVGINDAAIYHIMYGLEGSGFGEYLDLILITAFGVSAVMTVAWFAESRQLAIAIPPSWKNRVFTPYSALVLFLLSSLLSPTSWDILKYSLKHQTAEAQESPVPLRDYYIMDEVKANPAGAQRNLLIVYLESFERTYFDERVFPGLIQDLRAVEKKATSFTGIRQLPGTGWTIAGNVASQCGIPLVTPSHGNSMRNSFQFLPQARCLGDYLSEAGYDLSLIMGTPKEFAGTEAFAKAHGISNIIDSNVIADMPSFWPIDQNYWGVGDSTVFKVAENEVGRLHEGGDPFALFVSTMDTHHPRGHTSEACDGKDYGDGSNPMLNSVRCSDYQVARFVNGLLEEDYADDLIIVLVSDHLAMRNAASELLEKAPSRENLFMVIDPRAAKGSINNNQGSTLDIGSSILPFLGFTGRIGLGRDLNSERSLSDHFDDFGEQLARWETAFMDMWRFPQIEYWTPIEIIPDVREVRVGTQSFGFPLLLSADGDGKTSIYFDTDSSPEHRSLMSHFLSLPSDTAFLWVDRCATIARQSQGATDRFCMKYGPSSSDAHDTIVVTDALKILGSSLLSKAKSFRPGSSTETAKRAVDPSRFIAHAGGSVHDFTYTNSLEALTQNYNQGFRLFELDIIETSDGSYVAAHDWPHWHDITGTPGSAPPTREEFLQKPIYGQFTPLDMDRINTWFSQHPDAVLVTDKVDDPTRFARHFVAPDRLVMELFTEAAVIDAVHAGVVTPMPNFSLVRDGLDPERLEELGVRHVAASRRDIRHNLGLFEQLNNLGIKVFLYHANFDPGKDERFMVCNDMNFAFGIYADTHDFSEKITC